MRAVNRQPGLPREQRVETAFCLRQKPQITETVQANNPNDEKSSVDIFCFGHPSKKRKKCISRQQDHQSNCRTGQLRELPTAIPRNRFQSQSHQTTRYTKALEPPETFDRLASIGVWGHPGWKRPRTRPRFFVSPNDIAKTGFPTLFPLKKKSSKTTNVKKNKNKYLPSILNRKRVEKNNSEEKPGWKKERQVPRFEPPKTLRF